MMPIDEGEHDEAGAPHDDGGERVESRVAEQCDGIEVYEHPFQIIPNTLPVFQISSKYVPNNFQIRSKYVPNKF